MSQRKQKFHGYKQSQLDEEKVREAATALLAFHKDRKESNKATQELLLNEFSQIKIIISVWKILGKKAKTYQIKIPHSLRTPETEVCLFTKDENKTDSEVTSRHYQELLQSKGVTEVNEVMPLQVLKKEYKAFESRRQLAKRYDIFLADERIFRLMHVHLGKEFYRRKKYPATVNLTSNNLKGEILKAINATYFILTNRGNTNHLPVAHTGMTVDQVVENIMAAIQGITALIPHGWNNLKALYVRTDESVSLPIHTSLVFKEWETKPNLDHTDIWRLKKQLEVTTDASLQAKPRPTPEDDAKAKRFSKRSKTKATAKGSSGGISSAEVKRGQMKATKRKAAPEDEDEKDLKDAVMKQARRVVKEKPRKATSVKKAKITKRGAPGKLKKKGLLAKAPNVK